MMLTLREVTLDNFDECIALRITDEQHALEFVDTTIYSLAYSKVNPIWQPFAIYDRIDNVDTMIGFVLYGWLESDVGAIDAILIDQRYQQQGYGRAVMLLLIDQFRASGKCRVLKLTHNPLNTVAARLYASLGFAYIDEYWWGEHVMQIEFLPP